MRDEGAEPTNDSSGSLFGLVEEVGVTDKAAYQGYLTRLYLPMSQASYSHYLSAAIIYLNRRWQSVYLTSDTKYPGFKNSKW